MELNIFQVKNIIQGALAEDLGSGDLTTDNLFSQTLQGEACLIAKEKGIVAGLGVAKLVFEMLDPNVQWEELKKDGDKMNVGDNLACFRGSLRGILSGERLALNFIQRMSAIATKTAIYTDLISNYPAQIVDTRKTVPGLRILDKYAVKIGGGKNHRLGLFDAVMLKDNHLKAAGGITKAVNEIRGKVPFTTKIEVETETLDQVREALDNKVDIIMLDNMEPDLMLEAVQLINKKAIVEASGGITRDNLREVAATGVDFISIGDLTHNVKGLDISLNIS